MEWSGDIAFQIIELEFLLRVEGKFEGTGQNCGSPVNIQIWIPHIRRRTTNNIHKLYNMKIHSNDDKSTVRKIEFRFLQTLKLFSNSPKPNYLRNIKVNAGLENRDYGRRGIRLTDHETPLYPQKLALTPPTSGGCSAGIVRSRTKATELVNIKVNKYKLLWVHVFLCARDLVPSYTSARDPVSILHWRSVLAYWLFQVSYPEGLQTVVGD
jgi:hypothetical protein